MVSASKVAQLTLLIIWKEGNKMKKYIGRMILLGILSIALLILSISVFASEKYAYVKYQDGIIEQYLVSNSGVLTPIGNILVGKHSGKMKLDQINRNLYMVSAEHTITCLHIAANGTLIKLFDKTFAEDLFSSSIVIDSKNKIMYISIIDSYKDDYGNDKYSGQIAQYNIKDDGTIQLIKPEYFDSCIESGTLEMALHPFLPYLYTVNGDKTVKCFNRKTDGTLEKIDNYKPIRFDNPQLISISPDGKYLYSTERWTSHLCRYSIEKDGSLQFAGKMGYTDDSEAISPISSLYTGDDFVIMSIEAGRITFINKKDFDSEPQSKYSVYYITKQNELITKEAVEKKVDSDPSVIDKISKIKTSNKADKSNIKIHAKWELLSHGVYGAAVSGDFIYYLNDLGIARFKISKDKSTITSYKPALNKQMKTINTIMTENGEIHEWHIPIEEGFIMVEF